MQVVYGIDALEHAPVRAIVTSGTFDGVHLGHQTILRRVMALAEQEQGTSVLITYEPHPRLVLNPADDTLRLLNTLDEKLQLLQEAGLDMALVIPFTKEFSEWTSANYIQRILKEKLNSHTLVIGYDHRFGKNREGSFAHLKDNSHLYGFQVEEIPKQEIDEAGVSSTRIRKALAAGEVTLAAQLLGKPYRLTGQVIKGKQLARQLGMPTANLQLANKYKLVPAHGVYAVRVSWHGQAYPGVMNIGTNPTTDGDQSMKLEVHLFDVKLDLYSQWLTVELVAYLRPELKFDGLDNLKAAMAADGENARKHFGIG